MGSRGKSNADITTPPPTSVPPPAIHSAGSQDHSFFLQYAVQTERSIGELKSNLDALAKASEKHGGKIDALNETVQTAKGFLKAITIIGSISGAIGLAILGTMLKMLGDYLAKH